VKYKAILIDDEPLALQRLEKLLMPFKEDIEIVAKATNGADAIDVIDELKPDVIFLDIQMPELNGFEVLEKIKHQTFVIFSTAYDEYALKAFETNSIDYLLKPVDQKRLKKAIDKLKIITGNKFDDFQNQLQEMLEKIRIPSKRIQVKKGDKIKLIPVSEIYFFSADEKYISVKTFDNAYLIDKTLSVLEIELDDNFVRIHRGAIVNLNYIEEIVRMYKSTYRVKMKDDKNTVLPVSRQSKYKLGL